jgi:hypothetical protein
VTVRMLLVELGKHGDLAEISRSMQVHLHVLIERDLGAGEDTHTAVVKSSAPAKPLVPVPKL